MTLEQPFAPPSQKKIELATTWSYTFAEGDRRRCLVAFPLPGRKDGPRDFLVYLQLADRRGAQEADASAPDAVRGFLIQEVGSLAGKTRIVSGTARLIPIFGAPRIRKLSFDLSCEDDARLIGSATVQENAGEVRSFERRFAADIRSIRPATQPAEPSKSAPTTPRPRAEADPDDDRGR